MGRHGGGAFSGKDPSKVDRSAAYMGRWVAKNVVASGLAKKCEVQFAYAIGHPEPLSVHIDTFGTHAVNEEAIERAVLATFSFKPADIIKQLNLLPPDLFQDHELRPLRQNRRSRYHLGGLTKRRAKEGRQINL
jgi:S-adenosylmethionine synthetase